MSDLLQQLQNAAQQEDWPQIVQILQQLLWEDPSPAATLSELYLPPALAVLSAGDFTARWDIARLFPQLGEAAIAPLVALLQDADQDLEARWFATRILGQFRQSAAIVALTQVVQSNEVEELTEMATEALAGLGADAIAALTNLLPNPATRRLAVQALAQIHHAETVEPLLQVVADADATIRTLALEALSSFADVRIPPLLVQALTDPSAQVRQAAVSGLATRPEWSEALNLPELLADRLWDIDPTVCQAAAASLGRLAMPTATDTLFRGLTAPQTSVSLQLAIVRALGWTGSKTALDYLSRWLLETDQADAAVQREVIGILGRWADPSLKWLASRPLIQMLEQAAVGHLDLKPEIALALGQLGQPEALEPLISLLANPDIGVRLHAIAALKQIDRPTAYDQLTTLVHQPALPDTLRQGIEFALQEWSLN